MHGAIVVVDPDGPVASAGEIDRPFALASITKLFTATAVHVAVEEGTLALEDPAGPEDSTVAHLLAHASGLGPDGQVLSAPGRRRIYSNAGYDSLGHVTATASGMDFSRYASEAVVDALGLTHTSLTGSPAADASASPRDVAALVSAWLVPGALLSAETVEAAARPFLGDLAGVLPGFGSQTPNDWGLGPEIRGHKSPHWTGSRNSASTFGHFGQAGTCCWVDPVHRGAMVWLGDAPFGPWATSLWPALSDAVLDDLAARRGPS
ncbi:MAG TPA: serine hydrolase domain-containing protein [Acidimicrobiales bacterium]|nr:serine hydrolase domain-containing protein [Acidimicrobiales bacterium]